MSINSDKGSIQKTPSYLQIDLAINELNQTLKNCEIFIDKLTGNNEKSEELNEPSTEPTFVSVLTYAPERLKNINSEIEDFINKLNDIIN